MGNEVNRAHLAKDQAGLSQLIELYDLEKHVLPVLIEKSSHGLNPPVLRTWRYLQEPIQHRAEVMAATESRKQMARDLT